MGTTQQNAPVLRFPEFSGEWEKKKLGEFSSIKTGPFGSLLHQEDYVDKGTPIITVEHLGELGVEHRNLPLVSRKDEQRLKGYLLEIDDIVFSRVGSVDRNSIITPKESGWLFSGRLLRIRMKRKHSAKFLSFSFQQARTKYRIRSVAVGQTMPSLNTEILKRFSCYFPHIIQEQQKIAAFLSSVDTKIEQLSRKKALWERYKKGMMQKLFSQEIRFKDECGKDYPEWEEKLLGDFSNFSKGKGISKSDIVSDGAVKCIRYGELYTHYGTTISHVVSSTDIPLSQLKLSNINDVIIPSSGETALDIATVACLRVDGVALGGDINILRCQQNGVFLAYYLNYKKPNIARLAQGISVIHLYVSQLRLLKLSIPSKEEQQKIADFLSAIDKKIDLVTGQLEQARTFKKGLLQQMLI